MRVWPIFLKRWKKPLFRFGDLRRRRFGLTIVWLSPTIRMGNSQFLLCLYVNCLDKNKVNKSLVTYYPTAILTARHDMELEPHFLYPFL